MISIVDYGAGNLSSVSNMLRALGLRSEVVGDANGISRAQRLILPGVGHFDHGMAGLQDRGLLPALNDRVINRGAPILGICLGAQLIARRSDEGSLAGLGWIDADVVAFDRARMNRPLPVPHMGWAETWSSPDARNEGTLPPVFAEALPEDARFYYTHSFHLVCDRPETVILRAHHGYEFAAGLAQGNVIGFQFHPEKSHRFGKALLKAFATWTPGETLGQLGAS